MTEVFFLLFLRGIRCVSGVTLDKFSTCPDKPETLQLYSQTCIYVCLSIPVLLLDKLVLEIHLDLATMFTVFMCQFFE